MSIKYKLISSVTVICIFESLYATYVGKYTRVSPTGKFDISLCSDVLDTFEACGLRLTNTTCEPLDLNWCETNPVMLDGYTYLKKSGTTIMEFPVETNFTDFDRPFPITFTIGSVLEVRFAWHINCTGYRINLVDYSGNFVFHVQVAADEFYSSSKTSGGSWDGKIGHKKNPVTYVTFPDVQYTLKIVRGISDFLVYMNGVLEWKHPYDPKYEPNNIILLDSKFKVVQGDIYQLTFRSG